MRSMSGGERTDDPRDGGRLATISYVCLIIGVPLFALPLIRPKSDFDLFHARQCFGIWVTGLICAMVSALFTPFGAIAALGVIITIAWILVCAALSITGAINAHKGRAVPVPLLGRYAARWFPAPHSEPRV